MPQLPILPGMPGISGMRRPVAADAVRESELMRILGGTPPVVSPEEPEALKPWQLIGLALADAGATYGAGLNRNLLPGFQLRELQSRREQRAKEKTARKDRDAQQKFEAGLRSAATELDDIRTDEDRQYRRGMAEDARAAAAEQARLERESRETEGRLNRESRERINQLRLTDPKAASLIEARNAELGQILEGMVGDPALFEGKTLDEVRRSWEMHLDLRNMDRGDLEYWMWKFDKYVGPLAPQEEAGGGGPTKYTTTSPLGEALGQGIGVATDLAIGGVDFPTSALAGIGTLLSGAKKPKPSGGSH